MRWLMSMAAVALGSAAGLAHACSACSSPLEENRQAFVDTTIFLTFVPLIMIGGFIWWLRQRARELDPPSKITVPDIGDSAAAVGWNKVAGHRPDLDEPI